MNRHPMRVRAAAARAVAACAAVAALPAAARATDLAAGAAEGLDTVFLYAGCALSIAAATTGFGVAGAVLACGKMLYVILA
uniref:Uncharacterized protein n=1 Tax=Eiseniibacteriota bacterium TaxID=2212470 RepID=A0A832I2J3_UNCEI